MVLALLLERGYASAQNLREKIPENQTDAKKGVLINWLCGIGGEDHPPLADFSKNSTQVLADALSIVLESSCGFRGEGYFKAKSGGGRTRRFTMFQTHQAGTSALLSTLSRYAKEKNLLSNSCPEYGEFSKKDVAFLGAGCPGSFDRHADYEVRRAFYSRWPTKVERRRACDRGNGLWFDQFVRAIGVQTPVVVPMRAPAAHLAYALRHYSGKSIEKRDAVMKDTWNPLSEELGLDEGAEVDRFLSAWPLNPTRDDQVHPIIIENMSSSLVLFRRNMGWDLRDVIAVTNSQGKLVKEKESKRSVNESFPTQISGGIVGKPFAFDQKVYDAFALMHQRKLDTALRVLGEEQKLKFQEEVLAHRRIGDSLEEMCQAFSCGRGAEMSDSLEPFCRYACASQVAIYRMACKEKAKGARL